MVNHTTGFNGQTERLSVSGNNGRPTIDYELTTTQGESFHFEVKRGDCITSRRTPPAESAVAVVTAQYVQPSSGPVTLTVGSGSAAQVFQAASLWHLWIEQPAACRQHLAPMLDYLRGDWGLPAKEVEVEQELLRTADAAYRLERQRWATLLGQLADDRFAVREAADRQLRAAGLAVIPYLQGCEPMRLDSEQRFRIRRIVSALSRDNEDDSAVQTASWLSTDAQVWLSLLSRSALFTRQVAAGQLAVLLGGPIAFDPAAAEGVRKEQIEKLRQRLGGSKD